MGIEIAQGVIGGLLIALSHAVNYQRNGLPIDYTETTRDFITRDAMNMMSSSCLMAGAVLGNFLMNFIQGSLVGPNADAYSISIPGCLLVGILLGFGSRMSGGCTLRVIMADPRHWKLKELLTPIIILASAIGTVFADNKIGISTWQTPLDDAIAGPNDKIQNFLSQKPVIGFVIVFALFLSPALFLSITLRRNPLRLIPTLLTGTLCGAGMRISGIAQPHRVRNALALNQNDLSVLVAYGVGVLATFALIKLVDKNFAPSSVTQLANKLSSEGTSKYWYLGAIIYGIAFGFGCLCLGPTYINMSQFSKVLMLVAPAYVLTLVLYESIKQI